MENLVGMLNSEHPVEGTFTQDIDSVLDECRSSERTSTSMSRNSQIAATLDSLEDELDVDGSLNRFAASLATMGKHLFRKSNESLEHLMGVKRLDPTVTGTVAGTLQGAHTLRDTCTSSGAGTGIVAGTRQGAHTERDTCIGAGAGAGTGANTGTVAGTRQGSHTERVTCTGANTGTVAGTCQAAHGERGTCTGAGVLYCSGQSEQREQI